MRAPRKFVEVSSLILFDMRVQVPCDCEARVWNPPRTVMVRERGGFLEDCEGTPIRRPGSLLTISQIKGIAKVLLLIHTMGPSTFHGDLNCVRVPSTM